ncbi:MAG: amidase family protein, partial [Kiloniellales bacterium]
SDVAVARGLVPLAIGSDTSGSVRIPAALNGIVGYKASGGRYPMDGVYPLAPSLDTLGPLCRTVEDAILADAAMRGAAAPAVQAVTLSSVRLVVPSNVVFEDAETAVVTNFEAALQRLARHGVEIERQPFPVFDAIRDLFARHGTLVGAEAYPVLKDFVEGPRAAEMDHRVVARARLGASVTPEARAALLAGRARLTAEANDALAGRFAVFPTVAITAPALAPLEADDELFFATNALVLRNTMQGSVLDWCGVTIPSGSDAAGMPTGLLLNATAGADDALLAYASAVEAVIREPIPTTGQPQ